MISVLSANYLIFINPHHPPMTSINASNQQTTDKDKDKLQKTAPNSETTNAAVYFGLRSALLLHGRIYCVQLMHSLANLSKAAAKA
jgi:hypothetical protein